MSLFGKSKNNFTPASEIESILEVVSRSMIKIDGILSSVNGDPNRLSYSQLDEIQVSYSSSLMMGMKLPDLIEMDSSLAYKEFNTPLGRYTVLLWMMTFQGWIEKLSSLMGPKLNFNAK